MTLLPTGYSVKHLQHDIVAGLTVASVAVPQAIAYAIIAGIKPEYGLYTAIIMTALASLFGSSAHLINGPTNAISLVVFGAIDSLTRGPDDPARIEYVCLLAILVGLIQILIAILKLGDLTRYVSESVVLGFMAGAGVLVGLSQVHNLLGMQARGTGDQHFFVRLWLTLTEGGPVNLRAFLIGLGTILLVLGLHQIGRRLRRRLPELLLTLILVSAAVWLFDLLPAGGAVGGLAIPSSLPPFALPPLQSDRVRQLWGGALAIALLGLVEALAIAKALAASTRQPLDYNRQCLAEGIANLGGGFFHCMPGSGSLTRSAINYMSGAATRFSGIVSAMAVAATVLLFAPLARHVPQPALAGVVLWTAWRIVDRKRFLYCLRATRFDAGIALATAAAAVFLSIEFSILIGTFVSFLFFVPRAARLQASELTVSADRTVRERRPEDPPCNRLVILSLEGEFFFGAAPELDEQLSALTRRTEEGARVIVLRLKRARNPDMVCLERVQHFLEDMHKRGVTVLLCGVRADFGRVLNNVRFHEVLPADCLFLEDGATDSSTVRALRKAYELLGQDLCATCPRRDTAEQEKGVWHYVI